MAIGHRSSEVDYVRDKTHFRRRWEISDAIRRALGPHQDKSVFFEAIELNDQSLGQIIDNHLKKRLGSLQRPKKNKYQPTEEPYLT